MAFEKLDEIKDAFNAASKYMKPYFEPLTEFERLSRNKPHPNVQKNKMPSVTDGTLAAVVNSQPRRIIQQLPTGRVTSVSTPELAQLADFIWTNQILRNACTSGEPLQKCWIVSTKAKTYGCQPTYQFFNNNGEYYGADFMIPYIKDVFPEPGKLNANDSEYIFLQSWWTEAQVKALVDREKRLKSSAMDRGEQYDSSWNLSAMRLLLDELHPKDQTAKTPSENNKDSGTKYAQVVHLFQRGIGGKFFSYSPKLEKIIRTKVNPDPRGKLPVSYLYDTLDLSSPLGRGAIELSGGMQNLLDSEVQAYQFMRMMGMAPPLKKYGTTIANNSVKWKPFAVWDMGASKDAADLIPVDISTDAIRSFPGNYSLMKSQILNLTNNQDTSVSAEAGNPSFSKTQAGVKTQEQRIEVDDNYFRKQFETWFEDMAECMINIHFAESSGIREVQLTDDFLKNVADPAKFQPYAQLAPDGNVAQVLYDEITGNKFQFEVDASTSQVKNDDEQKDRLVQLLELGMKFPGMFKVDPLIERIIIKSGVEDSKELLYTPDERQQMAAQQQAAQAAQAPAPGAGPAPGPGPAQPPPPGAEVAQPGDQAGAPQGAPEQPGQLAPEDEQLVQSFIQAGFGEEQAMNGVQLMHAGYNHEQILQILTKSQQEVPA